MTAHYFRNELVNLHYYKFGTGKQIMLCFHGYGMHGKQFKLLEDTALGQKYTFIGFDLFFHKETILKDQSLETVKKGITKPQLAQLIVDFCHFEQVGRFSVMAYSMGTHYATAVAEELASRIDEYIVVAPACLNPGALVKFFSKQKAGNKLLEKLALSKRAMVGLLKLSKRLGILDKSGYDILHKEIGTAELRFSFYACFTYLRFLETNETKLLQALNNNGIKCIFIFGKRDKMYPPGIGKDFIAQLNNPQVIVLDETHQMINKNFVVALSPVLL